MFIENLNLEQMVLGYFIILSPYPTFPCSSHIPVQEFKLVYFIPRVTGSRR